MQVAFNESYVSDREYILLTKLILQCKNSKMIKFVKQSSRVPVVVHRCHELNLLDVGNV